MKKIRAIVSGKVQGVGFRMYAQHEEDKSKIKAGMAAQNFAIIPSIVLNILRKHGDISPTKTQIMIANNIDYLVLFLE